MQTQNIFDELYQDTETESIQGLKGLSELIYQTEPASAPQDGLTGNHPIPFRPRRRPATRKVTYYLSEKVVVELFEAKARIRIMVPAGLKSKVSMSRIVDYAVGAILDEFKAVGEKCELVKRIMDGK